MPSLGVVLPTKNSKPYLPRHLLAMAEWLDLASEVVVVDSFSIDGTLDYLRAHLPHAKTRFLSHPPGLYESWNYGLQNLTTDYAYIATAGDTITRDGLSHLLTAVEELKSDVIMSKPAFCDQQGQPGHEPHWPIDDILRRRKANGPVALHPLELVVYAATSGGGALLGSSASNLYRTSCLRGHPFPTEYGPAGDGAWAVLHAHELRWCVTTGRFSTFLMHDKSHALAKAPLYADQLLREALDQAVRTGTVRKTDLEAAHIPRLLTANAQWVAARDSFERDRKGRWPWSLNPAAWRRRAVRNRLSQSLLELRETALRTLGI